MTEIKSDLYRDQILNRKQYLQAKYKESINNQKGGVARRQKIFLSEHADTISDEELIRHKRELNRRKYFSFVSFFVIPGALYFYKFNTRVLLLSILPSFLLAKNIYNSSLLDTKCSYSLNLAENSQKRFLEKILRLNNKRFSNINDLLTTPEDSVPVKDWIARNEYR
jgi:hypothetical protein